VGLLIDTSVVVRAERGGRSLPLELERLGMDPAEAVGLSAVTAAELVHGVERADDAHRAARARYVEALFAAFPTLPLDLDVARVYGRLLAELGRRGVTVEAHDLQIAATALRHDWSVVTVNRAHFARVPGLVVIGP
jgi:tRNA(fMet)-specific endonuclease VapC